MAIIRENNGDASATTGTAYTVSLGDIFKGTLDQAADEDWVKVELTVETIYELTLSGVDFAELALFDSDGNPVIIGGEFPAGAKIIYSPTVAGTYYIHVGSLDSDYSGDYELSLVENTIPEGTYDEIADYLTDGHWEEYGSTRRAFDVESGGVLTANISALTDEGQQLAKWALGVWTNVTGLKFEFVHDDNAHITFDDDEYDPDAAGWSSSVESNGIIISSHINVHTTTLLESGTTIDSASFNTYVHEIGHALGLGHPGPYYGVPFYYGLDNIFLNDSDQATVMSYFNQTANTYINASRANVITPMIADIIAIQNLYGVPDNINTGDTIYGYNSNLDGYLGEFFRLWTGEANPFILVNVDVAEFTSTPDIKPVLSDLDDDGDFDLIIGSQSGAILYFENTGTAIKPNYAERIGADNPLNSVTAGSYSEPTLADLDGDSDPDLIIGNDYGELYYFENTGTDGNPGLTRRTGVANPLNGVDVGSYSKPTLADLDNDGDFDLLVGNDSGSINYFENTGTPTNPAFTLRTGIDNPLENINVDSHSASSLADLDGDGDFDIVIWGWYGTIKYFENSSIDNVLSFTERTGSDNPLDDISYGHYSIPTFVDLDDDSDLDLVIADGDGVIHYFINIGTSSNPNFSATRLNQPVTMTLYDNGGNDTLDLRTDKNDQRIYLRPEGISDVYGLTGNLIIARDTVIENFVAGSGNDLVVGNAVANYLKGNNGDDRIWGSGGDDILEGGAGADRLDGDAGMDWVSYRESNAAVTVNLAENTVQGGHAEGDILTEIENVIGSDYEDVLTGNDDTNRLEGGAGADRLDGGAGEDWVSYQGSDQGVLVDLTEDKFEGGDAQGDVISNIENVTGSNHGDVLRGDDNTNRLEGGNGDDWLYGSTGSDRLDGGDGYDVLSYQYSDAGVTINLQDGTLAGGYAEGDVFTGIEHIIGSENRDLLTGDNGPNVLFGIGGDDELQGNGGDDQLEGGAGSDRLDGGTGVDILSYLLSDAGVTVNLENGTAEGGDAQGDVISGFEIVVGSEHRDVLAGDDGANELYGIGGDDDLRGDDGDDVLEGGVGADQLDGGAGVDWVLYLKSDAGVTVNLSDNTVAGGHAQGDVLSNIENIAGSRYQDVLTGNDGTNELFGYEDDDELQGNDGDDVLEGGGGSDRLYGGNGTDTVSYKSSYIGVRVNLKEGTLEGGHAAGDVLTDIENITGSVFRDVLIGDDGANRLDGDEGNDELKGGIGNDHLVGNLGDDWLYGGNGDDELWGNEGNDQLFGEVGEDDLYGDEGDDELLGGDRDDQLFGGMGNDRLDGDGGNDELNGGDGNDQLFGKAGADRMDGGGGIDWISYLSSDTGVTVNLTNGTGTGGDAQGDVINNVENLVGSGYADVLTGDSVANILHGRDGDDELRGNGGNDVLEGGAGADDMDGGAGVDAVSYKGSNEGVLVDLVDGAVEGGHAEGDVITSIENVIGSEHEDAITGDNNANHLEGGNGDDVLIGGDGADRLNGGDGADWIFYWSSDAGVTVNLEEGTGKGGDAEGDVIVDVENVMGSRYPDILIGDSGDNFLDGIDGDDDLRAGDGNDWLDGRAGADRLDGGSGKDTVSYSFSDVGVTVNLEDNTSEGGHAEGDVIINVESIRGSDHRDVLIGDETTNILRGRAGNDELTGNGGDDWLYGNEGDDTFIFGTGHGDDRIPDFTNDEDLIDLSAFNLSGFDDLTITSISDSVRIDLSEHGGGTILLQNFDLADLDANDFLF